MTHIAIAGGGIGGLAVAIALRDRGLDVTVHEQTRVYKSVGDAINCTPNAVKALRALGLGDLVREHGFQPDIRINRDWSSGEATSTIPFGATLEAAHGAPLLAWRRSELVQALADRFGADLVEHGARTVGVTQAADTATLTFEDGTSVTADAVIGADGIHSVVREHVAGNTPPTYTGIVAYRTLVETGRLEGILDDDDLRSFVKWWGPDRTSQVVTYPVGDGTEFFVFATHADESSVESWSAPGDVTEMRAAFADWHPHARAILDATDGVLKTALHDRDPLPTWTRGRVTLLGDACHPMTPFMAQGAAMALEDAVVLAACVGETPAADLASAFDAYEAIRRPRTDRVQRESHANQWLKDRFEPGWLYGHDILSDL